jgi:acyl transferase domain-containing protein/NAD(P)-dependent dehydrogenase (short-subunit alcohol dehydrogenase family)
MSDKESPKDLAIGEPIAIVGIGCMFPQAPDLDTYWHNIKGSRDAITGIPASHWNPDDYFDADPSAPDMTYARRGGFLDPVAFNPLHYGIAPNTIEAIDSTHLLTLVAAEQALANAGYAVRETSDSGRTFDRSRTSVMLGVTGTLELVIPLGARLGHPRWRKAMLDAGIPADTTEEIVGRIADGYVPWQEQSFPGLLGNVTAGRIANRLDLGGANCVVDAACASSISAIHMAAMELALGRCDMAISGGVDTFNDIFMYMCFSKTPALSASGDARPFSADADGTMLGEGVGVVVLKRLSDARRDGDNIQAIIKGIGASSDGAGNAIYAPSSNGQSRALREAYRQAGVQPRTIELVEAHGTGTRVGDQVEANSLSAVFSEDAGHRHGHDDNDSDRTATDSADAYRSWCALGSVKSMIGHTKAAAGVAGLIKTVLALQHKVLPATLKIGKPLDSLTPGRSPIYLNTRTRPWIASSAHPRRAAVSAFGFGGSNFHCVLEEAEGEKSAPDWSGDVQLIALSANSREQILEQLAAFQQVAQNTDSAEGPYADDRWNDVRRLAKQSRDRFASDAPCRLVFVLRVGQHDDASLFAGVQALVHPPAATQTRGKPGVRSFYAEGKPEGRMGLVFPGQGSQRTNMLLDLSCQFPALLDRWRQVDDRVADASELVRISECVYPVPVFDDEQARTQEQALRATRIAQPALAAASLGLLDVLAEFGVHADAFAGHSFGEFIALHAAGAIDDDTLLHLARQRGECMERACTQTEGSMLAVSAPLEAVESVLEANSLSLALANHNGPSQVVLSGAVDVLDKARELLSAQGMRATALNVAGAFHSPLMDGARERFTSTLDEVEFASPSRAIYSNVSAAQYPQDQSQIRDLLATQITAPVRFVDMIRAMYDDGIHTFVEAGPGRVLQSLIGAILSDRPHQMIALDASAGKGEELDDLAAALAQLAAIGHDVDLRQWDPAPPAARERDAFSIPISGANHFQPKEPPSMQHRLTALDKAPQAETIVESAKTVAPLAPPPAAPQISGSVSAPAAGGTNMDLVQSTLLALQKMQQQTSDLHRQYLENQQAAQQTIELLIRQQIHGGMTQAPGIAASRPQDIASALAAPTAPQSDLAQSQNVAPIPEPLAAPLSAQAVLPQSPAAESNVMDSLLDIVAEKTGYPLDVLTPHMSLDADLGIDSIKRVEIFSALADRFPDFAQVSADEAGSLDTLQQIEVYLQANGAAGPAVQSPALIPAQPQPAGGTSNDEDLSDAIIAVIADKTGYPVDALNASMRLDEDLGIDSIKRVEILSAVQERFPHLPGLEADVAGSLQSIADIVELLEGEALPIAQSAGTVVEQPAVSVAVAANGVAMGAINSEGRDAAGLQIRQVIADKTGYPTEMLDIGMQLDADLGIDSIKRVEIFSVLQEQFPNAPMVEPDTMANLQRISDIIDYLDGASPVSEPNLNASHAANGANGANGSAAANGHSSNGHNGTNGHNSTNGHNGSAVSRSGAAMRYAAQMTLPTGAGNLADGLHRLAPSCKAIDAESREALPMSADTLIGIVAEPASLADALCQAFGRRGIFTKSLPVDQQAPDATVTGLLIVGGQHTNARSLGHAFAHLRAYGSQVQGAAARGAALLATVSRLDGRFALGGEEDAAAIEQPLSAGLCGLAKTAAREWPEVPCKSIDVDAGWADEQALADAIVTETLLTGPLEVGLGRHGPVSVELSAQDLPPGDPVGCALLKAADLVLVSGGARGISAAIAIALASRYQPTLLLVGRSPEPQAEPHWLHGLYEEGAIKQAIHQHQKDAASPKEIERVYRHTIANREMLDTLAAIDATGAKAIYRSVDIRDRNEVVGTVDAVVAQYGALRGIVHGAGVLADSLIVDKTDAQFADVMSTKCDGYLNLMACVSRDAEPAFIIACSSTTARLGRRGQADYAAANECMNKLSQQIARRHPGTKVLSVNWGPWDGGMVDARLKTLFEQEGVGLIPLDAGAQYLLEEMQSPPSRQVELVILGPCANPVAGRVETGAKSSMQECYSQEVSLATMPVLASHVINARAVVPVALIIEWLAHGALHASPGLRLTGLEDFRLLKGITLDAEQRLNIRVLAGPVERQTTDCGMRESISMELRSGEQLHARAKIHLGDAYVGTATRSAVVSRSPYAQQPYAGSELFHGTQLQGITRISGCDDAGISGESSAAPRPAEWLTSPFRSQWLSDPLVLDASFQMMILWAEHKYGHGSLPTAIGRMEFYAPFPSSTVAIDVRLLDHQAHRANASIEFSDSQGSLIARIEDYECVIDGSLNASFARNTLDEDS